MRGLAGSAVLLVACNGAGDAAREPPPAGLPWVGEAFDLRIGVAATTCAATGLPWASTFSQAIVVQSGARVTLTKALPLVQTSIRTILPGRHEVFLQVNGRRVARADVILK